MIVRSLSKYDLTMTIDLSTNKTGTKLRQYIRAQLTTTRHELKKDAKLENL